jgi:hypothetical protein
MLGAAALLAVGTLTLAGPAVTPVPAPKLLTPKANASIAFRSEPTFRVRDGSSEAKRDSIYIIISTSKKKRKNGDLKRTRVSTTALLHRRGDVFSYKAPAIIFRTWFLSRPGTYYWQAYRLGCGAQRCHVHSRTRSFKVRKPARR